MEYLRLEKGALRFLLREESSWTVQHFIVLIVRTYADLSLSFLGPTDVSVLFC